ncbi:LPS export ABC transporter periplasmic protein LptC [Desulfonatronovibrio hydrogenovorans]|uniref:LPS export ABC transporter periplasmic protein LptC n=1 Tax=Desulfonatronovibrio hydrogenovorans TaxID=53245 RepID=UPI00048BD46E|nr:LPS export ABC transporter periplasmic protein LptC [Desulfonatronovibrio hydrogenovorans]
MIKKIAPAIFSIGVLFFLFVLFWQQGPGPRITDISRQMEVDLNILDLHLVRGEQGKSLWELVSAEAGYLRDEDVLILTSPEITYFAGNDDGPLVIRAVHGRYDQTEEVIHLRESVRAEHHGMVVDSDKATYRADDSFILLENNVKFRGRGIMMESPVAHVFLDEDRVIALGGVSTRLH